MYCPTCGGANDESASFCKACGGSLASDAPQDPPPYVPNHLVWAILVTIFCCLPFGIVSIVYSAQVNGFVASGNIDAARQASENAKMWAWISFGVGIVLGLPVWIGGYAILGPIGMTLIGFPALLVVLVALGIVLYARNRSKTI